MRHCSAARSCGLGVPGALCPSQQGHGWDTGTASRCHSGCDHLGTLWVPCEIQGWKTEIGFLPVEKETFCAPGSSFRQRDPTEILQLCEPRAGFSTGSRVTFTQKASRGCVSLPGQGWKISWLITELMHTDEAKSSQSLLRDYVKMNYKSSGLLWTATGDWDEQAVEWKITLELPVNVSPLPVVCKVQINPAVGP